MQKAKLIKERNLLFNFQLLRFLLTWSGKIKALLFLFNYYMNQSMTKTLITGSMVLGLVFSTTPVFAAFEDRVKNGKIIKENVEKMKEKREENTAKRCEKVNSNIDKRVGEFNANKNVRIAHYQNIKTKFLAIADRLDKKGFDTTKLRADAAALDEKVKKLGSDYAAFIAKLTESKQYECGKSQGQFKTALEQSKDLRQVVFSDGKEIGEYVRTVLWADVQAFKAQKITPTGTQ